MKTIDVRMTRIGRFPCFCVGTKRKRHCSNFWNIVYTSYAEPNECQCSCRPSVPYSTTVYEITCPVLANVSTVPHSHSTLKTWTVIKGNRQSSQNCCPKITVQTYSISAWDCLQYHMYTVGLVALIVLTACSNTSQNKPQQLVYRHRHSKRSVGGGCCSPYSDRALAFLPLILTAHLPLPLPITGRSPIPWASVLISLKGLP